MRDSYIRLSIVTSCHLPKRDEMEIKITTDMTNAFQTQRYPYNIFINVIPKCYSANKNVNLRIIKDN